MEFFNVDSLNEAIDKLYNCFVDSKNNIETEEIDIENSLGRVISKNIISNIDVPCFDRSIVDGYAVQSSDLTGASETIPTFLKLVGESEMGEPCRIQINHGECVYIPTGGMLPKNADCCVMIENVDVVTNDKIAIYESISAGKNIIKAGSDTKSEEVILKSGKILTAYDIGLLSSVGIKKVEVYKQWNISIISTGDELVNNEEDYVIGKVYDINTYVLYSLCNKFGFTVKSKCLLGDDGEFLENTISTEMKKSDCVIISGGSSKGKKDLTSNIIDKLVSSKVITHGIAIKPGKPTITSYDANTNTFVIGLPGHPVACAILFDLLVNALYHKIVKSNYTIKHCEGILAENIASSPGRETIQLANIDDKYNVYPIYGKSGLINTLSRADGYIIMQIDEEGKNKGDRIRFYYL